jgi:hypothetical protein
VKALNEEYDKMCTKLILRSNFHTYTILCFEKNNKERYMLSDKKLAKRVYQSQLIYVFQFVLLSCILKEIWTNSAKFTPELSTMELYVVKFVTSVAMHLSIYREFQQGQLVIKYVMNHEKMFYQPYVPLIMGLVQVLFCFIFEFINMVILFSKTNVFGTVGSYLTVGLLINLSKIYYSKTVKQDPTNLVNGVFEYENAPLVFNKTKDMKYWERSALSKIGKVLYKGTRAVYASLIFYFVPFLYIVVNQNYQIERVVDILQKNNEI